MKATKESAELAKQALVKLSDGMPPDLRKQHSGRLLCLDDFISAASKRLPSQAAVDRDRAKKSTRAEKHR